MQHAVLSSMVKAVVCLSFLLTIAVSFAICAQATGASENASVKPAIISKAKEWFFRFQHGNIDRSQLDDTTNKELTEEMIRGEADVLKSLGNPTAFIFIQSEPLGAATGYDFLLQFPSARVVESIAFDGSGKIAGIDFHLFVKNAQQTGSET
ncbi:MAG: hypothetical protein JO009_01045 [Candidatus Eremiobacteraeota bacterium]|nr:hypothetical protein [Candidatus Eremiobacteraeota bacterium]